MTKAQLSILFFSERNALRGLMAEALFRRYLKHNPPAFISAAGDIKAVSAGLVRSEEIHPIAPTLMEEAGVDFEQQGPKTLSDLVGSTFDLIITLSPEAKHACSTEGRAIDGSDEMLPLFIGTPMRIHWTITAPDLSRPPEDQLRAARKARDELEEHIRVFVTHGFLEALATERRRARLLVDAIDIGLIVHDERRRVYLFNEAAERITGQRREDVLGRNCHDVFAPDGICGSHCSFQHGLSENFRRREYNVNFSAADGTTRRIRMLAVPMALHEGRPAEIVAQITDVTELDSLRWTLKEQQSLHGMVGNSTAMRGVFEIIRQVSTSDYPVLISGESGTGKELAARAIHSESRRSEGPFVPINCGALPEHILESELFGHVRGAFTGAIRDKKGRFELADGGTIFLDEVGELTPAFQVKLLRVLQEMRFERVGGERTIEVDVRVVSATNRDLRQMVQRREFREDLFYRLCVVPIVLPPLRDRRSDIPLLFETILERIQHETGRRSLLLSSRATDLLLAYRWPGNVRELINALQFAAVRSQDEEIGSEHLPPEVRQDLHSPIQLHSHSAQSPPPEGALARRTRKKLAVESVADALRQTGGNKVQAAKVLGVGRATLYRFLNDNPMPGEQEI